MPTFMFWNTQNGAAIPHLATACFENNVDVVVLAEDYSSLGYTEGQINSLSASNKYVRYEPIRSDVKIFSRLSSAKWRQVEDVGPRVAIRELTTDGLPPLLIVASHFPSKLRRSPETQYAYSRQVRSAIERAEKIVSHNNTIIIGDLNMDPFEHGIAAHDGLNGVMTRETAKKLTRTLFGQKWSFFYNPMWGRLGDDSIGPAGTYFNLPGDNASYYWHTFDQVLLRPSLIPFYDRGNLKILTKLGTRELYSNGTIQPGFSDHLPILITLR